MKHVHTLKIGTGKGHSGFGVRDTPEESVFVACAYAVPTFARACTAIRAIKVDVGTPDMGFTVQNEPSWQRYLLLLMIESTFRECSSTIKSLELSLPLSADFGVLHSSISKTPELLDLLSQLTSVSVTVNDATGPGGVRYWPKPVSDNQRRYPNQHHQAGFWKFVQLAQALSALCVHCTHVLNFDHMSMASFECLQELKLTSVELSGNMLSRIARNSTGSLSAVELQLAQLSSGTWSEVLTTFCELRGLLNFHMESCGYSATGSSSHYRLSLLPEPDNPAAIETHNSWEDYKALGAVQRQVNSLRAVRSLRQYTDYEYRFMGFVESNEETSFLE